MEDYQAEAERNSLEESDSLEIMSTPEQYPALLNSFPRLSRASYSTSTILTNPKKKKSKRVGNKRILNSFMKKKKLKHKRYNDGPNGFARGYSSTPKKKNRAPPITWASKRRKRLLKRQRARYMPAAHNTEREAFKKKYRAALTLIELSRTQPEVHRENEIDVMTNEAEQHCSLLDIPTSPEAENSSTATDILIPYSTTANANDVASNRDFLLITAVSIIYACIPLHDIVLIIL